MNESTVTHLVAAAGPVSDQPKKRCARCHHPRLRTQFYQNANTRDGLARVCKPCFTTLDGTRRRERNIGIALARAAATADVHAGEV